TPGSMPDCSTPKHPGCCGRTGAHEISGRCRPRWQGLRERRRVGPPAHYVPLVEAMSETALWPALTPAVLDALGAAQGPRCPLPKPSGAGAPRSPHPRSARILRMHPRKTPAPRPEPELILGRPGRDGIGVGA